MTDPDQTIIIGDNWSTGPTTTDLAGLTDQDLAHLAANGALDAAAEIARRAEPDQD